MSPTISIITVTYNAAILLEKTIQSVLAQTYQPIEYIIIDGQSTDNTVQVIQQYADGIDYWVSELDEGISDAFNKGILASTGEWLNFLNAGDVFADNDVVEKMISPMLHHDIVTSFAFYQHQPEKTIPRTRLSNGQPLAKKAWLSHQGTFFRRSVFDTVGLFDENYVVRMDYEFWLRALRLFDFFFIPMKTICYDGFGISSTNPRLFYQEETMANRAHLPRLTRYYWNAKSYARRTVKGAVGWR